MDFILTNDGAAVMTEAASGKDLVLTRAESGTGYSSAPATLSAVSGKQQDLDIEEVTFENQETRITVFLSNRLLETGYNLRQIGIYGKIAGSDQDVLMIVGQQYSGEPIHPIADGEEECRYNVLMKVSGTSSITVEGGSGSLATKRELLLHTENKKNPHNVTAEQVGLGNVPNVKTDDQTPTVEMASDRVNVAEKDTFKIIVGKMMKWFADLKTGAFSSVANNLLTTLAGSVLDARQGKVLKENIDAVDTKVTELSTKLTNENDETFNFGVKDGVRGFFTDPSRADDCFIPFNNITSGESLLSILLHGLHMRGGYTNTDNFYNLDFTNISSFSWTINVINMGGCKFVIYNDTGTPLYSSTSTSGTCDCESTGVDQLTAATLEVYFDHSKGKAEVILYITSYTTKDGVVHTK